MFLTTKPQRAWVNQPTTAHPHHHWHGLRVLAVSDGAGVACIYFTSGPTICARVLSFALSPGWPPDEDVIEDESYRNCDFCRHEEKPVSAEPCRSCDDAHSNWERKT